MEKQQDLLIDALRQPVPAISHYVTRRLKALYPGRAIIEGDACTFNLKMFVEDGHATLRLIRPDIINQVYTEWQGVGEGVDQRYQTVWYEAGWDGAALDVVLMSWPDDSGEHRHFWLIADSQKVAERFYEAVCEWAAEVRGEVLVFQEGYWDKSKELFTDIQNARFDNLVLAGNLKDQIRGDLERFFASRDEYEQYGVPWKRGILLLGPPGNGKTHCVKALINHLNQPCLYVKSFKARYWTDQDNIRKVFARARQTTPCLLVLEDLDSLVDDSNRAFFLNELDGFAANTGIVTLATTNHPERLDPAILDRPSRFDRKYHFELPGPSERLAYITLWNRTLQVELRLTQAGVNAVVIATEAFSFAYLKELFVSSVMAWINMPEKDRKMDRVMDKVMEAQAALLREQMKRMEVGPIGMGATET